MTSKIDMLNKKLEALEAAIDNNADGDPGYLRELMAERDLVDAKINNILYKDFLDDKDDDDDESIYAT